MNWRWVLILGTFAAVLWITLAPVLAIESSRSHPLPSPPTAITEAPPTPPTKACRCGERKPLPMVTVVVEAP